MRDDLLRQRKMNYGCGYDKRDGYLNVDMDANCAPDLLIENMDFSVIPRRHYEELLALDVLEHIPRASTLSALLDWADFLDHGGKLTLQTSNVIALGEMMRRSQKYSEHHGFTIFMYGNQAHPGDYHLTGFTEISLRTHLVAAGFADCTPETREKWLFYAETTKISDWTEMARREDTPLDQFLEEIYQAALGRSVDDNGHTFLTEKLLVGGWSRLDALRHVYQAPEHLFHAAKSLGFG